MTTTYVILGVGTGIVAGIFLAITKILWEGHDR